MSLVLTPPSRPPLLPQIFGHIQRNASPRMRFLVRASYLQIYNEHISDLLKPERSNLTIRYTMSIVLLPVMSLMSQYVVSCPSRTQF
jgi:hypothetical protein